MKGSGVGQVLDYKEKTRNTDIDPRDVAKYAVDQGWKLTVPDPLDRLANDIAQAIREEIRYDRKTGKPYRANHAYKVFGKQRHMWFDIDDNHHRNKVHKSLIVRRNQMISDGLQLSFDADHWNNDHPSQEPIVIPMDFTEDIEERKNAPDDDGKAA